MQQRTKGPDFELIENLLSNAECLCYGEGLQLLNKKKNYKSCAEKVALSSAAVHTSHQRNGEAVGIQSVVVVQILKEKTGGYEIVTHNGKSYRSKVK
jgi:hypothetical protein